MPADPLPALATTLAATGAARTAFLNVKDAAEYLGLSPHTLYVWRHRRQGPPSFRMGPRGRVMYRREALDAWIHEQEQADSRSNTALNPVSAIPEQRVSRTANT
ncbi:helix-turn-helix transcriptional regulator [Streptomyces ipomoeae]|uniref:helix-turn-helix transcriptional regulator n=1 Tax=Streptomyces ipomoeae TaxID=103232 RepID=UPI001147154F|nr:helix-turn-helix domain-containing protein [Streptomyces ipomoeae]MDX2934757.1 helix-turn-helix domain-containing protein [Streptomyces ipomoeae]TQE21060.1 DNA-binding protein [Streptomyces ipomoeae]